MADILDHIETLNRYRDGGYEPGSCTRAILENDLYGAARRADPTTALILVDIVRYMVNHLPAESWGSREKVDNWIRAKRAEMRIREQAPAGLLAKVEETDGV